MLEKRTFQIVLSAPDKPTPFSFTPEPAKTVNYDGTALTVKLP